MATPGPPSSITPGHAVIVRNPRARRALTRDALAVAAQPLRRAGWSVEIVDTRSAGDGATLARDAVARGADVVIACGGDGTVSEVANGLAGGAAALAVVPAGTANVWAREAFVPRTAQRALALVAHGRRARIDLGEAAVGDGSPRRFLLMCGAGLDGAVVQAVEARPRLKRVLGRFSFLVAGATIVPRTRPVPVAITHDDGAVERALLLAVVANTRLYGGMVRLADAARVDDGLLDVVGFSADDSAGPRRMLRAVALSAAGWRGGLSARAVRGIDYLRTSALTITPERPLAVQADGEFIGVAAPDAALRLRALPAALTVVIGRRANPLLGEGASGPASDRC